MSESKVIVITGASSGIGEATAKLVAKDGAKVILGARRENKLKKIADGIEKLGGEAAYQATDVTDDNQVEALAKLAIDKFGRIDVWLNNAGIMPQSILSEKKINDWNNMIDINIKGTLYGIGAAIPYMDKQKAGHIINVSSVAGHTAHSGSAVYSATKYAVCAISESLRQEMVEAKNNVRVTVISPGAINTDLLSSVTDPEVKAGMEKVYESFGISVDRVALTIKEAIDMPADAAWNEVIIRPTNQMG
ncbi:putative oxidoreductase [Lactiplantibacillus plantarum]|uniref:SDR family oxidoreductase n=1 Tax=Lactiplantibacillus plantarum TaxID=1590 RepID=UPI000977B973|nr:SDR family oxidoreductase [Lactiplantibacillus plantarum]PKX65078.1 NAD(P)-dependent oxidoreductase [Lactiplantibacillus plantarum]VFI56636.1 putative oxidoreductase [Lactiplantibacillus plantarum]VFI57523.1 putative oxidoreductase [Lactiplantibacillus plantarum]